MILILGATITSDISSTFGKINWSSPSWDMFIVLLFFILVFLYSTSLGRDRILSLTISVYMALAVANAMPHAIENFFVFKLITFWILFILLFFFLTRSRIIKTSSGRGNWWRGIIFSFFHIGLLISINLSFLSSKNLESFVPFAQRMFATDFSRFFWIIVPILLLAFIKDNKKID